MDLVTTGHPERPTLDMALTGALLDAVAHGNARETVRILRPDRRSRSAAWTANVPASPTHAVPLSRTAGSLSSVRRSHAAAYDPDCVLVEVIRRHEHLLGGLHERFVDMVALAQEALAPLGVTLELGELPGDTAPAVSASTSPQAPRSLGSRSASPVGHL